MKRDYRTNQVLGCGNCPYCTNKSHNGKALIIALLAGVVFLWITWKF